MNKKKTDLIILIINLIFLFFLYDFFYKERLHTYIDPDDNLHLILKSETTVDCLDKSCEGLNFFSEELKSIVNNGDENNSYLASRQFHRTISVYHPLVSYLIFFLNQIFDDYEKTFKIFLLLNFCLINFSLFVFCKEFLADKYLYFFYILILLLINSSLKASYMYAHSTAFAFGLLSFQNVLKNNNYKGAIFSILGILSHSIGIAYALIFVFLKFLLQKKYFILKNYIFFVLFSLIVLFFYNFNIQLTNTNISNTDLYSQFTDKLNILGTFKYQIFELKKHFETIPVFSSFGIYFVVIATLVSLSIKNSFIKNQKSLFCILVSLSITILISLFTNSSLAILERLQPIILLTIYICFFSNVFLSANQIFFYVKKKKINFFNINNFNKNKFDFFKFLISVIFIFISLVLIRIEFIKPDGMRYIAYLSTLDDSNYSSKEFDGIINSSKVKKNFLLDGSEATLYFHILNGLYNNKFYWSELYDAEEKKRIIKKVDYIILDNKLSFFGRNVRNAKQYYNQLYIDKNISLNLKNLDTKNIKIILNSLNEDVKVSLSSKDFDKKYELNKGINKIEISNDKLIKNLVISSQSKLLLSSIKISQDQISNWPWESRLIIEKKDIAKSINKLEIKNLINFKLKEKMLSNYNCENFSIISDNELFVYLKVDCQ